MLRERQMPLRARYGTIWPASRTSTTLQPVTAQQRQQVDVNLTSDQYDHLPSATSLFILHSVLRIDFAKSVDFHVGTARDLRIARRIGAQQRRKFFRRRRHGVHGLALPCSPISMRLSGFFATRLRAHFKMTVAQAPRLLYRLSARTISALSDQMVRRSRAGRAIGDFAWPVARQRDQILQRLDRQPRGHRDRHPPAAGQHTRSRPPCRRRAGSPR